jgi:hypothetical protein
MRLTVLTMTVCALYFFSVRRPTASYYLSMLSPAIAASAVFLYESDAIDIWRRNAISLSVVALFCGIFTLWLVRDAMLFANYERNGVLFDEAEKEFNLLARSTDQEISVSESLWVLANKFNQLRILERGTYSGDLMVLQQAQRGSLMAPEVPGYRLVSQNFVSYPPTCFGRPIGRTMPGYSFAVFARDMAGAEVPGQVQDNQQTSAPFPQ